MKIKRCPERTLRAEVERRFQAYDDWKSKEPPRPTTAEASVPRLLESPGPGVWLFVIPVAIGTGLVAFLSGTSIGEQVLGAFFGMVAGAVLGIFVSTVVIVIASEIAASIVNKRNIANGWVAYNEWQQARP